MNQRMRLSKNNNYVHLVVSIYIQICGHQQYDCVYSVQVSVTTKR